MLEHARYGSGKTVTQPEFEDLALHFRGGRYTLLSVWTSRRQVSERRPLSLGTAGISGLIPSRPSEGSTIVLLGGRVAFERMIVCGVVVAGCVQLWLA
jgi:hypothetical protein